MDSVCLGRQNWLSQTISVRRKSGNFEEKQKGSQMYFWLRVNQASNNNIISRNRSQRFDLWNFLPSVVGFCLWQWTVHHDNSGGICGCLYEWCWIPSLCTYGCLKQVRGCVTALTCLVTTPSPSSISFHPQI